MRSYSVLILPTPFIPPRLVYNYCKIAITLIDPASGVLNANGQALDIESPTLVLDSWCPPALHCQRTQGAKLGMGRTGVKRGRGLCVASADMYTPSTSKVWNHQFLCGHEHYDLRFDRVIPAFQRALAIACSAPVGPASNAGINENSAAHSWSHVERHGLATGMWALVRAE